MSEQISIREIWTSPDGKIKVLTSMEDKKYYCYKLPLFVEFELGKNVMVQTTTRQRQGKSPVTEIIGVGPEEPEPAEIPPKLGATPPKSEPAPQAVGMTTKELGDMIRAGKLSELFGPKAGLELLKWYRGQILATTQIPFDGAELPQVFKKKEA